MKQRILSLLLALLCFHAAALPVSGAEGDAGDEALVEALKGFFITAEGDYGSVNANDSGACSLGLLQWHGPRALELLRFALEGWPGCANYLTQALYQEISNPETGWSSRTLSAAEAQRISAMLDSIDGRAAQDAQARRDILGYLQLCRRWGMATDATAAYFAVIINQFGSGGAAVYLRHIRQTLGVSQDAVFRSLVLLHRAVHDTPYGQSCLSMRDKSYAYIETLGWDLNGPSVRRPIPAADSPLAQMTAREPFRWQLTPGALALLLHWQSLLLRLLS